MGPSLAVRRFRRGCLIFARHRLSPLAVFTSGAYFFFTMEGGDNKFAKFTVPTLKVILKVRSQNVSGNK